MKKVLMATTAVAAFVAFSGTAQAQDPGMADFGATEGGGGAGSAFTVKTSGAVKFYLKYASAEDKSPNKDQRNSGLFTLIAAELEFNGAATTDNGTDISTHIDLDFSGEIIDSAETVTLGSQEESISVGNIVRVQELSLKIGGGWGSVEMGTNDGAEDSLKTYGGSIAAGTGGVDGDLHTVIGGVGGTAVGGTAGIGDSSDALKVTYLSPNISGFQTGISIAYSTDGPKDLEGGNLGIGLGAKYSGSGGGVDYAVSLVWGAPSLYNNGDSVKNPPSGLGLGVKLGGAGVTGVLGVTIDGLGRKNVDPDIYVSPGVAYAIPGGKANVSLTAALALPYGVESGATEASNHLNAYLVMVSADYAILPGVTLATDLGYGDSDVDDDKTPSGGFTGLIRVKAAF